MSFVTKTGDDLLAVADEFAVEIPDEVKAMRNGPKKKQAIIDELADAGVDWDLYKKTSVEFAKQRAENDLKDELDQQVPQTPAVTGQQVRGVESGFAADDQVLLKMERNNPTYETYGVRFTKEHPFAVVSMKTALEITSRETGFRLAQQSEVEDYYGN